MPQQTLRDLLSNFATGEEDAEFFGAEDFTPIGEGEVRVTPGLSPIGDEQLGEFVDVPGINFQTQDGGVVTLFPGTGDAPEDVDLSRLERDFTPILAGKTEAQAKAELAKAQKEGRLSEDAFLADVPGQRLITNPKLQAFIDQPELAVTEARAAATAPGVQVPAEKIAETEQVIETFRMPPGNKPTEAQLAELLNPEKFSMSVSQYEQLIIDNLFKGEDPRLVNVLEEAEALTEDWFRDQYERQRFQDDPLWIDLDPKQKRQVATMLRTGFANTRGADLQARSQMLGLQSTRYGAAKKNFETLDRKATERLVKQRKQFATQQRQVRSDIRDVQTKLNTALGSLAKAQAELSFKRTPEAKAAADTQIKELNTTIKELQAQKLELEKVRIRVGADRAAERRGEGAAEGTPVAESQLGQPATGAFPRSQAIQIIKKHGGDLEAARQEIESLGFDPDQIDGNA